jgi:hypothetical protein
VGGEQGFDLADITFAVGVPQAFSDGFGAPGVGDGVTDEDEFFIPADFHYPAEVSAVVFTGGQELN